MSIRALMRDPLATLNARPDLLDRLIYGWNNEAWSADRQYLSACLDYALRTPGPFLECGSGLSTILIGAVAKAQGKKLWTLEHSPEWLAHVQKCLKKYSIDSVMICHAPLRRYNGYEWYDSETNDFPHDFNLVICDGPPGETLGGRFGLLPVMRNALAGGCTILLDDAHRPPERQIIDRWQDEFGVEATFKGENTQYAAVHLPHEQ
ncbi:O-methyltransferase [Lentisalinibacter orientalis]|uniref:hypothetical protein n=1 Tax=Lentisalinibacter orientalis TaxID=2992241 RepID=UPI00386C4133